MDKRKLTPQKLERIFDWATYGSFITGLSAGGILSYATENPIYLVKGVVLGAAGSFVSVLISTTYNAFKRQQ